MMPMHHWYRSCCQRAFLQSIIHKDRPINKNIGQVAPGQSNDCSIYATFQYNVSAFVRPFHPHNIEEQRTW
eukprot:6187069-Amphidinium_carterae.2